MGDAVILALIAIISGGGGIYGRYLLTRIAALEAKAERQQTRIDDLQTTNATLSISNAVLEQEKRTWLVERAEMQAEITELKGRVGELEQQLNTPKTRRPKQPQPTKEPQSA